MENKKILSDGSIDGETFSGDKYDGEYPSPNFGKEKYGEYFERVNKLKEQGFHLGDLTWHHWGIYCQGSPYHDSYLQNEIIE